MSSYDCQTSLDGFNLECLAENPSRSHYEVTFPAPFPIALNRAGTVYGDLFVPRSAGEKLPLLILAHGFGDQSMAPCLTLARLLARQRIITLALYLPVHSRRLNTDPEKAFSESSPENWLEVFQSSVTEIRTVVDWASGREDVDPQKIGVAGISMGGMVASIAMAFDPRIAAGVFIVIGGDGEELS